MKKSRRGNVIHHTPRSRAALTLSPCCRRNGGGREKLMRIWLSCQTCFLEAWFGAGAPRAALDGDLFSLEGFRHAAKNPTYCLFRELSQIIPEAMGSFTDRCR